MKTDDFMRRVIKREAHGHIFIETMECGHTNSTGRIEEEEYLPCLTCEIEAHETAQKPVLEQ